MRSLLHDTPDLELELLRRGVHDRVEGNDRCAGCHRTPLIGERVYIYNAGAVLCELCKALQNEVPARSEVIHGPEFGHTMKLTDRRAA